MKRCCTLQKSIAGLIFALLASACAEPRFQSISGPTMGTYYAVRYQTGSECLVTRLEVDEALAKINAILSTYQVDSELSRFNTNPSTGWVTISTDLAEVLGAAAEVWQRSGGAFDVTVGPLVNLWGFGPQALSGVTDNGSERATPSTKAQIEAAAKVGMDKLLLDKTRLLKRTPGLYIDLSALAKGHAVDRLAQMLVRRGCDNYMVDIGGEIRVAGSNAEQRPWRIGIEVPDARQLDTLQAVLSLSNLSIATSGDYRNFRMIDGVRVDHVIDPRIGKPASNDVVSATVIHSSAMWADAYATTIMVLGVEQGLAFADAEGVAAYVMSRRSAGAGNSRDEELIEARYNEAMRDFLPRDE